MPELQTLSYRAFISYSHADTGWARWLHRALESFRIDKDLAGRKTATGVIPEALRPVFRDRDEFSAGKPLTEQTLAALDVSHALIVLCSPASAGSAYVNEETRLFKSRHPERPVIPLIVDGKPGDPERECFPAALRFKIGADGQVTSEPEELLAADAREESDGRNLALAKVIAGLLDVPSDDIFRRAERERRAAARRKRRVQVAFGALAIAVVAGLIAWMNEDYLRKEYYWHVVMRPTVLTPSQESALEPGDQFTECKRGCPTMVVIPAGTFTMGSAPDEKHRREDEGPQHEVTIAKPFAVSKFEATFDDWDACVAYGDCPRAPDGGWGRGRQPAINVSWEHAQLYVAWLSKVTGKTYRLLSEAEWEYAARGGTQTAYFWGDEIGENNANCNYCGSQWDNRQPAPVGSFAANAFGLYDMAGNVYEWVEDCNHDNYDGAPDDGSAWVTGNANCKDSIIKGLIRNVLRGGSWVGAPHSLRSASRHWSFPVDRNDYGGFRIGRTLDVE